LKNIKLIFSYDGSLFFGSQAQNNLITVQGSLETAIQELTGKKLNVMLAGRTDRGVHATGQVANFKTNSSIPAGNFAAALNGKLKNGIVIDRSESVPAKFDSRRSAKSREYVYLVYNGKNIPVVLWGRALQVTRPLNIRKMALAAKCLIGKHDFSGFCAKGSEQKYFIRHMRKLEISCIGRDMLKTCKDPGRLIRLRFVADSYLYKMIRLIVGMLIDIGVGRMGVEEIKKILKGTSKASKVVSPCGLYLCEVKY
jgi:tRNA pseudouridine38-40 synthase